MANTRQSAKRARQSEKRSERNRIVRTTTRTALKGAVDALKSKDLNQVKAAYAQAVKAVSKAASKGAVPAGRAARKISRLTQLVKKTLPQVF